MPAADFGHPQTSISVPETFLTADITPLAGRVADARELDEGANRALANAIEAAFGPHGCRAAMDPVAVASARTRVRRTLALAATRMRADSQAADEPAPIRSPAGWRNG